MNPYDKARELANAIESSDIFKKFQAAKQTLESDPSAKSMVEDFQNKQLDLQKKQMLGEDFSEEDSKKIQELFKVLSLNNVANEYLQAEFAFAQMMQDISKTLSDIIEK